MKSLHVFVTGAISQTIDCDAASDIVTCYLSLIYDEDIGAKYIQCRLLCHTVSWPLGDIYD